MFPESRVADPEDRLLLEECMRRLTETEQQIVILHAVAGMTFAETARYMNMKLGTALSKYHRAIQKLRRYYEEEGES